jgi:TPR repeat protein
MNSFLKICFFFSLLFHVFSFADSGVEEFNQKKYDSAFRKLLPEAESGQPAAMFYFGRIILEGLGSATKDVAKGQFYIQKSADKNYEPAIRFLALNSEKSGNLKLALSYYERLQKNGDLTVVERMAELNEQLYNKERDLTISYCTSLENAKILNKNINEYRYANCLLEEKIQGKTRDEGFALLKVLADKGQELAIAQIVPYMLRSRNDKYWNPIYIDELFFKNLNNIKLIENIKIATAKSDINFETCRFTVPGTTYPQQNYRASICRLSAIKGDQKAVQFVAERHLLGFDGFVQDLKKSNYFINIIDNVTIKTELKLYQLQLEKNYSEHYNLLSTNTNIDIGKMNEGLDFQLSNVILKASKNELTMPTELAKYATLINEYGDCKIRIELSNLIVKYYDNNQSLIDEDRAILNKIKPNTDCSNLIVARPRRDIFTPISSSVPVPIPTTTTTTTPAPTKIESKVPLTNITPILSPNSSVIKSNEVNPSKSLNSDFSTLLDQCDKKEYNSCLQAADLVSNKIALKEITDDDSRTKIIIEILDKAANLGSIDAKYRIYDVLSPIRLPSATQYQRYKELLADFESLKTDSANIRIIHDSLLSFNPIGTLFQTIGGKTKELCLQAILLNSKINISSVEKKYLDSVITSVHCKALK